MITLQPILDQKCCEDVFDSDLKKLTWGCCTHGLYVPDASVIFLFLIFQIFSILFHDFSCSGRHPNRQLIGGYPIIHRVIPLLFIGLQAAKMGQDFFHPTFDGVAAVHPWLVDG